ncbi:MAG: sigma-E factor negative regulatory protein [Burkholderiales bacterium]
MERISAFMDGEAAHMETQQAIARLKDSDEHRDTWGTFHLIGDMMRGDPLLKDDFMARFRAQMELEPTQLAPRVTWRKSTQFALSAAASLSAVAIVVAIVLADSPLRPQAPALIAAKPPADIVARSRPAPAANQRKVNEYLMAHQEYSPSTAFQGLAPYVRTVSESHEGDGH